MSGETACTQTNTLWLVWMNSKVLVANVQTVVVTKSANNNNFENAQQYWEQTEEK